MHLRLVIVNLVILVLLVKIFLLLVKFLAHMLLSLLSLLLNHIRVGIRGGWQTIWLGRRSHIAADTLNFTSKLRKYW